ncbi:GATA zinc finger domain-containing protein 4-like [Gordionus sp. m RMFG-2023]|uniref:GATA zinc finger domain-containing protein 4-like n=1 Tax=Gordionus sp. m RMFG-2023 TaxID=3053472 RepID=UPI0031FCB8A4
MEIKPELIYKIPKLVGPLNEIYLDRILSYFSTSTLSDSIKINTLLNNLSDEVFNKICSDTDILDLKIVTKNYNYNNYHYNNNNQSNYGRNNTWHENNQRDGNRNNYQSYYNNSNNNRGSDNNQRKQIQYNNNSNNYRGGDNNNRKQIQYNNVYNMNIEEIIEEKVDSTKNKDDNDFNVNNLSGDMLNDKDNAFMTTLKVNNIVTCMQVDTGSKHTIISHGLAKKLANVDTNYEDEIKKLIKECESKLTNGPINKAKRIPYSKIDLVSNELKKWIHDKIIDPVNNVRWASPVTAVYKDDGSIRLCADFKDTVNPALEDFRYPLPRINDLIAKLSEERNLRRLTLKCFLTDSN